jgi:exopolyphosphatase / guanosine-5'-triphosphate,3'-diphosphate pyrophosphatase
VTGPPRAAIDIGTNSVRLLISDGHHDLERHSVITRLGAAVSRTHRLDDDAIDRTLAAIEGYKLVISGKGDPPVHVVATSAARDAVNREVLFDAVEQRLGVRPELLSGEAEARLSFLGAVADLDPASGPFLVVDVGGGSTELALGTTEPSHVCSLEVGAVRLTESELHHDPPLPEELTNAIGLAHDAFDEAMRAEIPDAETAGTLVGVGGTITTLAAIEIGLAVYDRERTHHFRLAREAVEDVFRTLATETLAARKANPGLQPERADVIVGGCCIVVALMRRLHARELLVCDADLLDALVMTAPEGG